MSTSFTFSAEIKIIDINPYVFLPEEVLEGLFIQAGKSKGPIPVKGIMNGHGFIQTLVKFRNAWRLYLNTPMREATNTKVGDTVTITISYDSEPREEKMHPKLKDALHNHKEAKRVYDGLRPSLQKEIIRYINFLKTEESVNRNVEKAIRFLLGKERFIGRDKP